MPGLRTVESYSPVEIRGPGAAEMFLTLPCTVEEGQDLAIGTVIGLKPTSDKYVAYDKTAAAEATAPAADEGNTGGGTCSTPAVQDAYTLTEAWTLTCKTKVSSAGVFTVVGSVSGAVADATVAEEYKYPANTHYQIKFTLADGTPDFEVGDKFTFTTTAAGAQDATGILKEAVDATDGDIVSGQYVKGVFTESLLTGLDDDGALNMLGKTVGDYFIM